MVKCPYCGHENEEQGKICSKCYAQIPVKKPEKPKKGNKTQEE